MKVLSCKKKCVNLVHLKRDRGSSFFVTPGKFAQTNPFQWSSLKEGMTLNCTHILVSVGSALDTTQKKINQKNLYHRFVTLLEFRHSKKKFLTPYFFWGKTKLSPTLRLLRLFRLLSTIYHKITHEKITYSQITMCNFSYGILRRVWLNPGKIYVEELFHAKVSQGRVNLRKVSQSKVIHGRKCTIIIVLHLLILLSLETLLWFDEWYIKWRVE